VRRRARRGSSPRSDDRSRRAPSNGFGFGSLTRLLPPHSVDRRTNQDDPSPSLPPHYRASQLPRDGPPLCPASVLSPSRICRSGVFLPRTAAGQRLRHWPRAGAGRQVHAFGTGAQTRLAPPPRRTPPGQSAGFRQAHPRPCARAWFRCHLRPFDASSVVRFRSPSWPTPAALGGATSPQTLSTPALDRRTLRWFTASPCRAAVEDHRHKTGPSISDAAPHQVVRSSTSASLMRSCSHSARGRGSPAFA
jgi:hypothetical protein